LFRYKLTEDEMFDRVFEHTYLIIDKGMTIREASDITGWSKTTVDIDVTERLRKLDSDLADEVQKILDEHYEQRCIRGARATREKYANT
jgi:putative DeoR family transcriptional regulator, stage III sporulation protein D